jgi:hypothetical protein
MQDWRKGYRSFSRFYLLPARGPGERMGLGPSATVSSPLARRRMIAPARFQRSGSLFTPRFLVLLDGLLENADDQRIE